MLKKTEVLEGERYLMGMARGAASVFGGDSSTPNKARK